jgi:dihydrofolate synthase/folylpolyglutamate synthase
VWLLVVVWVVGLVGLGVGGIDVLVLEVGMGGSWDSTNTADGDGAVIAPIDLDHADRLGETIAEIASVKAGIIKDGAAVVSARQSAAAEAVLRDAAAAKGATIAFEGQDFALVKGSLAVGGQAITVRGLAGVYEDEYLPLYGAHQGFNAALAIAAVESLIGGGAQPITGGVLAEGLGQSTSPGRLQLVGVSPTVLVDAAHTPHGARALVEALRESFDFDEWGIVLGVLADKDAAGIVAALAPIASHVFATAPDSDRANDADRIADLAEVSGLPVTVHADVADASEAAREWAAASDRRAVVIAGSVVLAGEAIALAEAEDWKSGWRA